MVVMQIEPLNGQDRSAFDSGKPTLDNYLKQSATKSQLNGSAKVFLGMVDGQVVGYYTLSATSIAFEKLPKPSKGKSPHFPVPSVILGCWAVDKRYQGQGFGKELMFDAMIRTVKAAKEIGISVIILDPIDDAARDRYMNGTFGWLPLKDAGNRLYLAVSRLKELLEGLQLIGEKY